MKHFIIVGMMEGDMLYQSTDCREIFVLELFHLFVGAIMELNGPMSASHGAEEDPIRAWFVIAHNNLPLSLPYKPNNVINSTGYNTYCSLGKICIAVRKSNDTLSPVRTRH